ncbi:MAG: dihydrofolate reductase [Microcoleus sp.]
MISLLAAVTKNNVIGRDGDLPWRLPDDLRHFKELTTGKTVVMGRKTYDAIFRRHGGPLPNRHNIVLTHDTSYLAPGVEVVHTLTEALPQSSDELFVIGGAEIYQQTLANADRLYLTEISAEIDGDAFFPEIDKNIWHEVNRVPHTKDERHEYAFDFVVYERAKPQSEL